MNNNTPKDPGIPPEAPASETEPLAPIMAEDGAFTPEWYSRFDELQPFAGTLSKFRRPEALAKSYAHLERLKGYPGAQDPERMAAFRASVGLPETAEDYSLPRPDGTPDEVWNDQLAGELAQVAYEYGVPAEAMAALSQKYAQEGLNFMRASKEAEAAAVAQAEDILQEEWGPRYEDNMQTVGRFLQSMGNRAGVDVQTLVESPALRANPDFARLILTMAESVREAPWRTGAPQEGKEEARRIASDPTHPLHEAYMRSNHPQHRYANEQYDRLAFGRDQ